MYVWFSLENFLDEILLPALCFTFWNLICPKLMARCHLDVVLYNFWVYFYFCISQRKKKILAHSLPTLWMDAKYCFDLRTLFLPSSIFQLCKNVKKCLYNKKWTLSSYSFVFGQIIILSQNFQKTKYIGGNVSQQLVTKRN